MCTQQIHVQSSLTHPIIYKCQIIPTNGVPESHLGSFHVASRIDVIYEEFLEYNVSHKFCPWRCLALFHVCMSLLISQCESLTTHILQGCITDTKRIAQLPQCQSIPNYYHTHQSWSIVHNVKVLFILYCFPFFLAFEYVFHGDCDPNPPLDVFFNMFKSSPIISNISISVIS